MKTKMMAILIMGTLGISITSFAAELCGKLTAEALNGSEGLTYFITNDSGENVVVPESDKVRKDLYDDINKFVCATGKNSRNGFMANSVMLNRL